jgi:hypothetical protein
MIQVVVKPHADGQLSGKYDIYVYDGDEDRELLLFSNQGYENRDDAVRMVRRLLSGQSLETRAENSAPEPVDLCIKDMDGRGTHEMIR